MSIQFRSGRLCCLGRPVLLPQVSGEMRAMAGLLQGYSAREADE